MQLVAYGAQDIYLTGNPQITFFKVVYRRHTNFSIENIQQTFNGTADFNKKVSCTISRNGDLVHRIYLQTTLPEQNFTGNELNNQTVTYNGNQVSMLKWVDYVGEKLIKFAEVEIGGQRIDKHYGEWLHIWNQLTCPAGHEEGYQRMIGNMPALTKNAAFSDIQNAENGSIPKQTLYIPLQFWFCRNPGLALPLIALQYHEVKINIEFEELKELLVSLPGKSPAPTTLDNTVLWVDYIFLDTDERRRFAQLSHEYLIEQLQYPGEETITTSTSKIRLNFNHPVKELVWVTQTDDSIQYLQHYNYTDAIDTSPTFQNNSLGSRLLQGIVENIQVPGGTSLQIKNPDTGANTCDKAKIQLNGQDRFSEQDGNYFNYVQPYNHHTRTPAVGINVYSFALKPEEHQPSGTCNFSRVDNANLFLTVTPNTTLSGNTSITNGQFKYVPPTGSSTNSKSAKVRVYATNYNVLRIMSGMGGLAYSN